MSLLCYQTCSLRASVPFTHMPLHKHTQSCQPGRCMPFCPPSFVHRGSKCANGIFLRNVSLIISLSFQSTYTGKHTQILIYMSVCLNSNPASLEAFWGCWSLSDLFFSQPDTQQWLTQYEKGESKTQTCLNLLEKLVLEGGSFFPNFKTQYSWGNFSVSLSKVSFQQCHRSDIKWRLRSWDSCLWSTQCASCNVQGAAALLSLSYVLSI